MFDFPLSDRVRTAKEYAHVFNAHSRRYVTGKWFKMVYLPHTQPRARLGLIVSKKWSKSAVKRNLVKRVVRESFRLEQKQLFCADIVIMAKYNLTGEQRQYLEDNRYCIQAVLRKDIKKLWKKIAAP